MASLKDLRNRISSVKSTQKITKAMQMVAAAKLRKAQDAAEAARPYSKNMARVVANLSASMAGQPGAPELLIGTGQSETHLLIVMTADRGLCGGFNTNIVRKARERIVELQREGKTVKIMTIGRKGADQLRRLYGDLIVEKISLRDKKEIDAGIAIDLGKKITDMFEAGEFDVATMFFAEFKNVLTQVPTGKTIIPAAESLSDDEAAEAPDLKGAVYIYEPGQEEILEELLPRYINSQIFFTLLENAAGEQGARMSAMDNATRNAGELIDDLTMDYNRSRQAKITTELIEIISGAEAL
ncbi:MULTISPECIES: F0F1 ATP synthase subunit gamma [Euryhalocaulis]|uniref:F0F1 ATP synthase subunit gamma n=1 Tax=Euryhalocaulis TaxID=1712422 RepID=UPI00039B3769|nr:MULTISPECIES: F0F1 ATP synthase subunit gamma [Euryhalocaulis]MBA4801851.1 F0F1 ATP synthase subunit gamma [Euryhalocaulis sp.]